MAAHEMYVAVCTDHFDSVSYTVSAILQSAVASQYKFEKLARSRNALMGTSLKSQGPTALQNLRRNYHGASLGGPTNGVG